MACLVVCIALSLLYVAAALSVRLLPQYLSFLPDYPSTLGVGYLSIPISADLLQQTTLVDDYSISLWYKSNVNPPSQVPIFQVANATWGDDCCNLYDANSALYFKTSTSLAFGLDFYNYVGARYTAVTTQTVAPSDLNWHFVGVSKCKSQKVIRLCKDGICTETAYKADIPITQSMMIYIGGYPTSYLGGFSGRIGDMVLYTNACYSLSDFASVQTSKPAIPNCATLVPFGGSFFDACSSYAQLVSVLFMSSGSSLSPNFSPYPFGVSVGSPAVFYGRTLGDTFGMTGFISSTAGAASVSFTRTAGIHTVVLSVTAGLVLSVTGPTLVPATVTATCTAKSYVRFYLEVQYSAGTTSVGIKCDGPPSAFALTSTYAGGTIGSDTFSFKGSMFDVKIKPLLAAELSFAWLVNTEFFNDIVPFVDSTTALSSSNVPLSNCAIGYYQSSNRCWKCHPACQQCSDAGYDKCSVCSASYYRQPTSPTLCLSYCPTGYTASGSSCVLSASPALDIVFDDNLAGDITLLSGQRIQMGWDPTKFYPDFDFLDPFPVRYRGVFYNISESISLPNNANEIGSLMLGSDFSVDMWILPYSYGSLFRVNTNNGWQDDDLLIFGISQYLMWPPTMYRYYLSFGMKTKDNSFNYQYTELEVPFKTEWMHVGFSAKFDLGTQTTNVLIFLDSQTETLSFPSYFQDSPMGRHNVGFLSAYLPGYLGFIYSMTVVNLPKTMTDFAAVRGTCSGCVCPLRTNSCLSTCSPWSYVGEAGSCQACQKQCKYGCTRPTSCNLCEDDLCYKCKTFEAGSCTECIPGASYVAGRCVCPSGTFVSNGQCRSECDTGYFFSSKSLKCEPCQRGCVKCDQSACLLCRPEFVLSNGICSCGVGWYITAAMACGKCNAVCKNCMDDKANCTECYTEQGYVLLSSTCVDCRSISGYGGGQGKADVQVTGLSTADAVNAVCQEICGDGVLKGQLECDDANLANGDGCSNQCQIEHGWTCASPTSGGASQCSDNTPPQAVLTYVQRSLTGYELTYSFSEDVVIVESLNSLVDVTIDEGSMFTYTFEHSAVSSDLYSPYTLTITASQTFPAGSMLTLLVSDVSKVTDASGNRLSNPLLAVTLKDTFNLASTQAVTTTVTAMSGGIAGIAGISALTSMLGGSSLSLLWGLLETMQIINYLVYMSVAFPDNLRHFLRALNFANFEFVPNFFDKYENDEFDQPPQAFITEKVGTDLLINIGNMVTIWVFLLLWFVVVFGLSWLFPKVGMFTRLYKQYEYASVLRVGTESFLQLALAVLLQMRNPVPHSTFGYFSLLSCAAVFAYLALSYVVTILKVTRISATELREKVYKAKFGTLYRDYHLTSSITRSFQLVINSRRTLYVLALVCVIDSPIAQATLLVLLTLGYLAVLVMFRPYKRRWTGNLNMIVTELVFLLAQCFIAVLCSNDLTITARNGIGWVVILLLGGVIVTHLIVIVVIQVQEIMKLVQKCNLFLLKGSALDEQKSKRIGVLPEVGKAWMEDDVKVSPLEETKEAETEQSGSNILFPLVVQKIMAQQGAGGSGGSNSDSPDEAVEDKKPKF